MDSKSDLSYLYRALQLAEAGRGRVSPNPMVGCVIVADDKIIGEGFHQKYGGPHAEVNAIGQVQDQEKLSKSTLYVTLEPCSHHGKTPPCTDLIIRKGIKKVVIAATDPNPLVNGKGIQKLRDAGVEVTEGILAEEAGQLNIRFNTFHQKKRPYILLKWAQTTDGFIARKDYNSRWISNSLSRQQVHKWRSEEDAILIGKNTAQYDDPSLTTRDWTGKDPIRIVLDRQCTLPKTLKLFMDGKKTLVYNLQKDDVMGMLEYVKVSENHFLTDLLDGLHKRNIQSLIVEGGAQTIQAFIQANLWDEARVFVGEAHFGEGIKAPELWQNVAHETKIAQDRLLIYKNVTV